MHYVSPVIEALRASPRAVFWTAAAVQTATWALVPSLIYGAPPGDLPEVLAIGREWRMGFASGPPLAFWLADLATHITGGSPVGVYLLSQVCILVALWAVFTLGCGIVGARHAVLAALLMVGVSAFALPSVEFGPAVLAMPLMSLALLYFWRAVSEARTFSWIAVGVVLGALVLANPIGPVIIVLIMMFLPITARGRAALSTFGPWAMLLAALLVAAPYLGWLATARPPGIDVLPIGAHTAGEVGRGFVQALTGLLVAHAGIVVLILLSGSFLVDRRVEVPVFARAPLGTFAKAFVWWFALAPALAASLLGAFAGRGAPFGGTGPLVVMSGLLAVLLVGNVIHLRRQRIVGRAWLALLFGPPAVTIAAILLLPWFSEIELRINEPARAMAQFFTETFHRRTGKPLSIVIGDARLGGLVAFASRDRPHLVIDGALERAPWVRAEDIRDNGAIVLWRVTDTTGTPPPEIGARFPGLVAEIPQGFARPIHGRLPLMRVGWAVIRPASQTPPSAPPRADR